MIGVDVILMSSLTYDVTLLLVLHIRYVPAALVGLGVVQGGKRWVR